jgi:hypothetical protein
MALRRDDDYEHRSDEWRAVYERLKSYDDRLKSVEDQLAIHRLECANAKSKPIDITQLSIPTRVVVAVVGAAVAIAGGIWASTSGIRSDVRDILTQQTAYARMADERAGALKESISDAKKLQELQRIQLESLTKTVLTQQRR